MVTLDETIIDIYEHYVSSRKTSSAMFKPRGFPGHTVSIFRNSLREVDIVVMVDKNTEKEKMTSITFQNITTTVINRVSYDGYTIKLSYKNCVVIVSDKSTYMNLVKNQMCKNSIIKKV